MDKQTANSGQGEGMSKKWKCEIGQTVYFEGCSKEYQEANPFIVKQRKRESTIVQVDGVDITMTVDLYSNDDSEFCAAWFAASSLTPTASGD